MKERVIAKRYAQALFEVALEKGVLDETREGLDAVARALKSIPLFSRTMMNTEITAPRRKAVMSEACAVMKTGGLVQDVLCLMLSKERLGLVIYVAAIFRDLAAQAKKLTRAEAILADEASSKEVCSKIKKILEDTLKQPAQCESTVDPSLLGGAVLKIGDTVYDASVKGRMKKLKERMLNPKY
jgi:F-type H+-transporting ATPase subunit delta